MVDDAFLKRLIEKIPNGDLALVRQDLIEQQRPTARFRGHEYPIDIEYVLAGYTKHLSVGKEP